LDESIQFTSNQIKDDEIKLQDVGMLYYKTASDEQKIITLKVAP